MMTTLLLIIMVAVYWFTLRRWFARWGATPDELARTMAGDAIIPAPTHTATQAITVKASPDDIWPWLVQIGYQRGGLYSYDWLDRLFGFLDRPSANRPVLDLMYLGLKHVRMPPETLRVMRLCCPTANCARCTFRYCYSSASAKSSTTR